MCRRNISRFRISCNSAGLIRRDRDWEDRFRLNQKVDRESFEMFVL